MKSLFYWLRNRKRKYKFNSMFNNIIQNKFDLDKTLELDYTKRVN